MLRPLALEGWPAAPLGEEAGAKLWIGEPEPDRERWLLLTLPAADLAADAEERACALVAAAESPAGESSSGAPHWALPRVWQRPGDGRPARLALPAPGAWRADALLPAAGRLAAPELLCRLLLAELLDGLAAAHRRGWWHGLLGPGSLWLAGAPPTRLIADCPRDPRVVVVGCGVLAMLLPRARAAAVARAPQTWLAPELRRGAEPGPASDLWAAAAIVRSLLPIAGGAELQSLLDALQARSPEARRPADAAAADAREIALAAFAAWQRGAPPPPRLVPSPAPLLGVSGSSSRRAPSLDGDAAPSAPSRREANAPARWTLQPPSSRTAVGLLPPLPFIGRPLAAGSAAPALWLSMAPTAMAGILSVLLAMALLFAAQ